MSLAIASRYANALADVVLNARSAVAPQTVIEQLRTLDTVIESSNELRSALLSPAVSVADKNKVVSRLCDQLGMNQLVRNFVVIVVRNRRANLFPQILAAFERMLDSRMGIVKAEITSAAELSPESKATLQARLEDLSGKRVRCNYSVDPHILGGAVARIGSTIYDGSVRGQLDELRKKLAAGA